MSEQESGYVDPGSPLKSIRDVASCSTHSTFLPAQDDQKECVEGEAEKREVSVVVPKLSPYMIRSIKRVRCDTNGLDTELHDKEAQPEQKNYKTVLPCVEYLYEHVPEVKEHFDVLSKIGEGTFSSVYVASVKGHSSIKVALKHVIPTLSTTRIENEIRCLKMMGGRDNVIEINTCIRHRDHVVLIMPYFPHDKFTDYLQDVTIEETRLYMHALFQALSNVHKHHIIHRDIKPSNFLYNRATKRFQLIDFGLAHLESCYVKRTTEPKTRRESNGIISSDTYQKQVTKRLVAKRGRGASTSLAQGATKERLKEGSKAAVIITSEDSLCPTRHNSDEVCGFCMARNQQVVARAGTPGFRAPEVLLKCPIQTTAVDVWSAGVILLCLLSGRYPIFRAHDDQMAMAQIISLMGSRKCAAAATSCGKEIICEPEVPPTDLKLLCQKLKSSLSSQTTSSTDSLLTTPSKRTRLCKNTTEPKQSNISCLTKSPPTNCINQTSSPVNSTCNVKHIDVLSDDNVYDLLYRCLDLNPVTRITAVQALNHPFIVNGK